MIIIVIILVAEEGGDGASKPGVEFTVAQQPKNFTP